MEEAEACDQCGGVRASKLILVSQAAKWHGLNSPQLYRAIRAGDLPAFQIGAWLRVRMSDVDAWIEGCRIDPSKDPQFKFSHSMMRAG